MTDQISYPKARAWGWDRTRDLDAVSRSYDGASPDSVLVSDFMKASRVYFKNPGAVVANFLRQPGDWRFLEEEFLAIQKNCAKENWDGEEASKISKRTIAHTRKFLDLFPAYLPLPDVAPEPDGHLSLGWFINSDFLFEISIDGLGNLFFAGRFGTSKISGRSQLNSQIPSEVLEFLGRFKNRRLSE